MKASTMEMKKAPRMCRASVLKENLSLNPRTRIESSHVHDLARALLAGAVLPPIIADEKTQEIVDGVHRRRAFLIAYGEDVVVPVEWRSFASDADRLACQIEINSKHGLRYSRTDEIRCTIIARSVGLSQKDLQVCLQINEERLQELSHRIVLCDGKEEPAKRVASHLYEQEIGLSKTYAMMSFSSLSMLQHVGQLRQVIDADLFDSKNQKVVTALLDLAEAIRKHVRPIQQ